MILQGDIVVTMTFVSQRFIGSVATRTFRAITLIRRTTDNYDNSIV